MMGLHVATMDQHMTTWASAIVAVLLNMLFGRAFPGMTITASVSLQVLSVARILLRTISISAANAAMVVARMQVGVTAIFIAPAKE
mmetsp:Transcript_25844/g.39098  ORF Transcript_25844/g.39098 Transcript_25844/m.39098 type:complete len:86 (-) Transcript_25844:126-383(-)